MTHGVRYDKSTVYVDSGWCGDLNWVLLAEGSKYLESRYCAISGCYLPSRENVICNLYLYLKYSIFDYSCLAIETSTDISQM